MKKGRLCRAVGLLLCVLPLLFTGCRRQTPPASALTVLSAMSEGMSTTHIYTRAVAESDGTYLSDTLFSALFGEAARGLLRGDAHTPAAINDVAILLSISKTPVELAVFRCSDARGTATAEGLARTRLDAVRRAWVGTEWEVLTAEGFVAVEGSYVLLIITPHPDRSLRIARQLCR